jgi:hypothetical protein
LLELAIACITSPLSTIYSKIRQLEARFVIG